MTGINYKVDSSLDQLKLMKKNLYKLRTQQIDWGWVDRHKRYPAKDRTRTTKTAQGKKQGIYVAQLAFWQEYGTKRVGFNGATINQVPRPYFEQSLVTIKKSSSGYIKDIFHAALLIRDYTKEADNFGNMAEDSIRSSVAKQNMPELKPSTRYAKGNDYQWVETNVMMSNISHKLVRTQREKK